MNAETFLQQRRPAWQRMEELLATLRRSPRGLSGQELEEFGRLYRATASDLALAQRDFPQQPVTQYLNQLVGNAHAALYRGEPLRWRQLKEFYTRRFPQLYRRLLPYTAAAFGLFLLPALTAFLAVWADAGRIYLFEGPEIAALVDQVERGELWTEIEPAVRSAASSMILTNNIQVMFLTFAGGMTAGLLTAWVMISNGMHLGAVFGLLQVHGLAGGLGEFVLAHGFIELSVIFLAGGCGLYIGDGLLRPGLLSRQAMLSGRVRLAVTAILGCVPLLVLAGLIEGFISPSGLPVWVKAAVGVGTGIALHWYWLRVGRETTTQGEDAERQRGESEDLLL